MSNVPNYQTPQPPQDVVSTLIPYRNVQALIAYYLGIFSLFPVLGSVMGIIAVILGIRGLMYANKHPEAKGQVHAWVGIICGAIFGILWTFISIMIIGALIFAPRH